MTTIDVIRKLELMTFISTCKCCRMFRTLEWEDMEVGLVCESCADELRKVDLAVNYDIPCGWRRPTEKELCSYR